MSEWANGTLADAITSLDAGVSVNAEDRPHGAGEIGVLKTSAIIGGAFRAEQNKAVLQHERRLVAEPVQADSILVSRMNTPALVGESCYVREAHPTLFLPDRLWQLKPRDRTQLSIRWLSFVLQSADYRRYVEVHATGTSGSMKNLPKSKLLALPVQYPEPAEQVVIAQVLDTLDTAIRETEVLIDKLKAVKQGLLHDLLTRGIDASGQLRPPQSEAPQLYKESPLGWIPRGWSWGTLGHWLTGKPKNGYSPQEAGEWTGIQMLGLGCLTKEGFFPVQLKPAPAGDKGLERALLSEGDLLISRANTKELVGLVGVYRNVGTLCTYPDLMMRLTPSAETSAEFLQLVLQSNRVRRQIQAAASGTSESMVKISASIVTGLKVAIPELDEQGIILCRAKALDGQLQSELEGLEGLRALKSGLMDDLLTGRVRVTPLLEGATAP